MKQLRKCLFIIILLIISLQTFSFAEQININSEAAILVEVSTGRILYEKNSTKTMYPASTTKVMTAILIIENCDLNEIVTVKESSLKNIPNGYVTCNLQPDEEISVKDLLYALMIPSANDAAVVLADYAGGSINEFANMMNNKARELGCQSTNFVNPNGIHDSKHYTTAYDLYLIASYAMKNDTFRKIVSTKEYTLPATNKYPTADRHLKNSNELINPQSSNYYYPNAIGIKTGFTSQAGNCLIAQSSRDGLDFITVVLNGGTTSSGLNARFVDAKKLFDYGYDNYTLTKIIEKNSVVSSIEIANATKETKNLDLIIDKSITVVNNISIDMNNVIPEISLRQDLAAPITTGEIIGTVKYKVDDIEYSANLLAKSDVIKQNYYYIYMIIGAIILLLISSFISRKNKRKNKKKQCRNINR